MIFTLICPINFYALRNHFDLHDGGHRLRQVQCHCQGLKRGQNQHGQGCGRFGKTFLTFSIYP